MKVQVVASKYNENANWIRSSPYDVILYSKTEGEPNYVREGKDTEASSYLYHIIHNYDNLSLWTLFVHAHEYHWHHPLSVLKSMEIDLDSIDERCKFFSINHGKWGITDKYDDEILKKQILPIMMYRNISGFTPSELSTTEYCQVMKDIFGVQEYNAIIKKHFPNQQVLREQRYSPSAQFYVHRDRIRVRPKSFYEHCYQLLTKPGYILQRSASRKYSERKIGTFFFEANWHYIFGEDYLYTPFYQNYQDFPFKTIESKSRLNKKREAIQLVRSLLYFAIAIVVLYAFIQIFLIKK